METSTPSISSLQHSTSTSSSVSSEDTESVSLVESIDNTENDVCLEKKLFNLKGNTPHEESKESCVKIEPKDADFCLLSNSNIDTFAQQLSSVLIEEETAKANLKEQNSKVEDEEQQRTVINVDNTGSTQNNATVSTTIKDNNLSKTVNNEDLANTINGQPQRIEEKREIFLDEPLGNDLLFENYISEKDAFKFMQNFKDVDSEYYGEKSVIIINENDLTECESLLQVKQVEQIVNEAHDDNQNNSKQGEKRKEDLKETKIAVEEELEQKELPNKQTDHSNLTEKALIENWQENKDLEASVIHEKAHESFQVEIQVDEHYDVINQDDNNSPIGHDLLKFDRRRHSSISIKTIDDDDDLELELELENFEPRNVVIKRESKFENEYELMQELGRGRFGSVYKCIEKATGTLLAAKFIKPTRQEERLDVEREVSIMRQLQHKRLLQLYDAFDDVEKELSPSSSIRSMYLVTELIEGGELFERIVDDDFDLTEKKAAIFMRQICEGTEYMHQKNIVHLDMKPENIMCVSHTGNRIKLIDFGLARQLKEGEQLRVMFGTLDFAAPEVLSYDLISLSTDMWSVGVICYVLLSGLLPFAGNTDLETMSNVMEGEFNFDDEAFELISDLAKNFITKLLVKNPHDRPSPTECLKHPWLQKGGERLIAAVRDRRASVASLTGRDLELISSSMTLSKQKLKRFVIRRRWHKAINAIIAIRRMGAKI